MIFSLYILFISTLYFTTTLQNCMDGLKNLLVFDLNDIPVEVCASYEQTIFSCDKYSLGVLLRSYQNVSNLDIVCQDCKGLQTGFFVVDVLNGPYACAPSNQYVKNCKDYLFSQPDSIVCSACHQQADNYVRLLDGGHACAEVIVPNCLFYSIGSSLSAKGLHVVQCASCDIGSTTISQNRFSVQGYAQKGVGCPTSVVSNNCLSVFLSKKSIYSCTFCRTGNSIAKLSDTSTICTSQTLLQNCLTYQFNSSSQSLKCSLCQSNFNLIVFANSKLHCMRSQYFQPGCTFYNDTQFQAKVYACTESCQPGYNALKLKQGQYKCAKIETMPNCLLYSALLQAGDAQLFPRCTKCSNENQNGFCLSNCKSSQKKVKLRFRNNGEKVIQQCWQRIKQDYVSYCSQYLVNEPIKQSTDYSQIQCITCQPGSYIATSPQNTKFCMPIIQNCLEQDKKNWGLCLKCKNDLEFDPLQVKCKSPGQYINNCMQLTNIQGVLKCTKCGYGYDLLSKQNLCVPSVQYCSLYSLSKICLRCIPNYILIKQICYKKPQNCEMVDYNIGVCLVCSTKYILKEGFCHQDDSCEKGYYKNKEGKCIKGNFKNCGLYSSNGTCLQCAQEYRFSPRLDQCVALEKKIECPETAPLFFRYQIYNGKCILIDQNCKVNGFLWNGACFDCREGFYSYSGKCYQHF